MWRSGGWKDGGSVLMGEVSELRARKIVNMVRRAWKRFLGDPLVAMVCVVAHWWSMRLRANLR